MKYWVLQFFLFLMLGLIPLEAYSYCQLPENYSPIRPSSKEPTRVTVGIWLNDIPLIDDIKSNYTADFLLTLEWKDPRLVRPNAPDSKTPCIVSGDNVWIPAPLIGNGGGLRQQMDSWLEVYPNGNINWAQRYYGPLASPLNLKEFPFDHHILEIRVIPSFPISEVEFVPNDNSGRAPKFSVQNWEFGPGDIKVDRVFFPLAKEYYSRVIYEIKADRDPGYYVWQIIFPILLIVLMSWTVFWIPPDFRVSQIMLSSTSFLTLIAFQIRLSILLPPIPYLTKVGVLNFGGTIIVFLSLVEAIATSVLAGSGHMMAAKRLDRLSRFMFPIAFLLFGGFVMWWR